METYFFFAKHDWSDLDNDADRSEPRVCLLISEQIDGQSPVRLGQAVDPAITYKEVFVVKKSFVRRRFALEQSAEVLDHDVNPDGISQDLIREVMLDRIA